MAHSSIYFVFCSVFETYYGSMVTQTPWISLAASNFSLTCLSSLPNNFITCPYWCLAQRYPPVWELQSGNHQLVLVAVSHRYHPLVTDLGVTTEVVARVQGHLVGHRILLIGVSSYDLVIIIIMKATRMEIKGEANSLRHWRVDPSDLHHPPNILVLFSEQNAYEIKEHILCNKHHRI